MSDRDKRSEQDHGSSPPPSGGDEVHVAKRSVRGRRSLLYKALTLVLVAGCARFLVVQLRSAGSGAASREAATREAATRDTNAAAGDNGATRREAIEARPIAARTASAASSLSAQDMSRDLSEFYVPGQPVPTMNEVIDRLHKAGIRSGLGAFSPPGTSPPLVGIAVPEDFPLPEGYVRHYQATDDGRPIEAILMFSPDFEFHDASGRSIAIPENRVVPPEWAPPGLPIRLIEIPRPL